jgi:hypothetical protein
MPRGVHDWQVPGEKGRPMTEITSGTRDPDNETSNPDDELHDMDDEEVRAYLDQKPEEPDHDAEEGSLELENTGVPDGLNEDWSGFWVDVEATVAEVDKRDQGVTT